MPARTSEPDIPEIEALRLLLEQCRQITVEHGQSAFAKLDARQARAEADRLDLLERAEDSLDSFEAALKAFPEVLEAQPPTMPREVKNASIIDAANLGQEVRIESGVATARGYWDGRRFTIAPGSQMRVEEVRSIHPWLQLLRKEAIDSGTVQKDGTKWIFTEHAVFSSPSAAAGVVLGRSANGPQEWKLVNGEPLGNLRPKGRNNPAR